MGSQGRIVSRRSFWLVLCGLVAVGAVVALTRTGIQAEVAAYETGGLTTTPVEVTVSGAGAPLESTGEASCAKALTGLSLSPEGVYFDGPKGGPFRQSEGTFRVTNTSLVTVNWSVDEDGANLWAIISSAASGALAPGEFIEVVVQLDAGAAAAFAGGSYTANLIVHNMDSGDSAPMPVNLFVADPLVSTTHPNPNLWFANTTFDVAWTATFYPSSTRFLWKVDDQPDSVITDTDPDIHTASGVRQAEVPGNAQGKWYFHLVAIDPATTGIIPASLRHYQYNVVADPPTVTSSSHPNGLSMERDFLATPVEYDPRIDPTSTYWTQVGVPRIIWQRYSSTMVVFQDKLWVLGGQGNGYLNDVWSSPDGAYWTQATGGAEWPGRYGYTTAVFQDKLWVLGGTSDGSYLNDVWSSADGARWTQVTPSGPIWSERSGHTTAVFQDKLWVLGGYKYYRNYYSYLNDVWSSADGARWTQVTPSGPIWSERSGHTTAVFDNKLWVLGGYPVSNSNDVWRSPDGAHWTQVWPSGSISLGNNHTTAVFHSKLWVLSNGMWFLSGPTLSRSNFVQYLYLINLESDIDLTEDTPGVLKWTNALPIVVSDQKPGERWFHVAAQDTLAEITQTASYHFTVGDAVSVVSASSHLSPSTKKDVTVSWTDGGLPPGMLDRWYYVFDDKPTTPVTTGSNWTDDPGKTFTCNAPGTYYLHIATYDTYRNLSTAYEFYGFRVLQSAAPQAYADPPRVETKSYACRDIVFRWTDPETADPAVMGYRYVLDQQPGTDPGNPEAGETTSGMQYSVQDATLGTHYFHVVSQDACEFYSKPGHFRVNIRRAHAPVVRLELNSSAQLLHFTWTDPENPPFADCYLVACDKSPRTTPTTEVCDDQTFWNQFDVTGGPTPWYLHLVAEDVHKNQSDPVHYAVMVGGGMSLAISNPSKEYTKGGEDITYDVIYAGVSASSITLKASDITVHATGTATATVSTPVPNGNIRTITFPGASISGNGTVYFSLAAGTATGPSGPAPAMDSPPFTVDNTKPQIAISAPSATCATEGPVAWTVTYSDAGGLDWASLSLDDIAPVLTGSVTVGAWDVVAVNATTFTVTADEISGKGTLGFSIAANTAADFAGNSADAANSPTCMVDTTPPQASPQTVSLHMNTSKSINITATDSDDPALSYEHTQPAHGTLSGTAPILTYTPAQYFVGTDQFTFTASDGCYTTNSITVTLNITNTPPAAQDQAVSLHMNTSKAITAVATDADGDPLTYTLLAAPSHGDLTGTLPNVTYTPDNCYVGADQFQFRSSDGQANSNTATVAITVTNAAPVAQDQSVSLHMNATKDITVVASDADGDPITYTLISQPAHGTLTGTLPTVTYTPEPCFVGTDELTFKVNDCQADSNTATIHLTVNNQVPVLEQETIALSLHMNTTKDVSIRASDPDSDPLTYTVVSAPVHGKLSGDAPNFTYTPDNCFSGSDGFVCKVCDCATSCKSVTVTFDVTNAAPVAQDQPVMLHMNATKDVTVVASDADGDAITYTLLSQPAHGTLNGTLPAVTYTPEHCFVGTDEFTFKVNDCAADSTTAVVSIGVTNTPPTAQDLTAAARMNSGPQTISVIATDPDGDAITYTLVSGPTHGTLGGTLPNVTYAPESCYIGPDAFTFRVNDCQADSNVATVSITVANEAPIAQGQDASLHMNGTKAIVAVATDPDGNSLLYTLVSGPAHGTLSGSLPSVTYTPETCYAGPDAFTFKVNDCQSDSNTASVNISVENAPPVAQEQLVQMKWNTTKPIALTATDPESDPITFEIVAPPSHGALSGTPPDLVYTPEPDFVGQDMFTFKVSDCQADSSVATVTIDVAENHPPDPGPDQNTSTTSDTPGTITLTGSDPDGDPLTYRVVTPPDHGSADVSGSSLTYTPEPGYVGPDTFQVVANDGTADSAPITIYVTIVPPPVGSLTVTLEPEYARSVGAQWRVDGGGGYASGQTVGDLAVGDHVVSFSDIPARQTGGGGCGGGSSVSYRTPAEQHVTISAGANTPLTVTYETAKKNLDAQAPIGGHWADLIVLGCAAVSLSPLTGSRRNRTMNRFGRRH